MSKAFQQLAAPSFSFCPCAPIRITLCSYVFARGFGNLSTNSAQHFVTGFSV
ncbi:Uncharacterised protein [Vibrio cholerae]|nr:Uncharacterised protein [Vibrio cholerae]